MGEEREGEGKPVQQTVSTIELYSLLSLEDPLSLYQGSLQYKEPQVSVVKNILTWKDLTHYLLLFLPQCIHDPGD